MASNNSFADGDLGRIQGLLFGDAMSRIEARLDELEGRVTDEVKRLDADLDTERETRSTAVDGVRGELTQLASTLEDQASGLADTKVDRAALAAILDDAAGQLRSLAAAVDAGADSDE